MMPIITQFYRTIIIATQYAFKKTILYVIVICVLRLNVNALPGYEVAA
jgi:hypothetical protein